MCCTDTQNFQYANRRSRPKASPQEKGKRFRRGRCQGPKDIQGQERRQVFLVWSPSQQELHLELQVRQPVKHPTVFEAFLCKRPSNQRFVCISTRFGGLTWYEIVWIITKHRPTLHRHTDPIELKALDAARSVKLPICNSIKSKLSI